MAKVTAVAAKFKLSSLPPKKSHSMQDGLSLVPISKLDISRIGWKASTNRKEGISELSTYTYSLVSENDEENRWT